MGKFQSMADKKCHLIDNVLLLLLLLLSCQIHIVTILQLYYLAMESNWAWALKEKEKGERKSNLFCLRNSADVIYLFFLKLNKIFIFLSADASWPASLF